MTAFDTTDPAAVVIELNRRFAAGDGAGASQLFRPDVTCEQPSSLPHGGVYHGLAGLGEMGANFGKFWERTIENPRIFGSGESAAMLTTQTWTAKQTGKTETCDVIEVFTVIDGVVTGIRVFQQDTHRLLATLEA